MILLTDRTGEDFYINPDHIVMITPRNNGGSEIERTDTAKTLVVSDEADDIVEMIEGWERAKRMPLQISSIPASVTFKEPA